MINETLFFNILRKLCVTQVVVVIHNLKHFVINSVKIKLNQKKGCIVFFFQKYIRNRGLVGVENDDIKRFIL